MQNYRIDVIATMVERIGAVFRELGAFDLAFDCGLMGREWHLVCKKRTIAEIDMSSFGVQFKQHFLRERYLP